MLEIQVFRMVRDALRKHGIPEAQIMDETTYGLLGGKKSLRSIRERVIEQGKNCKRVVIAKNGHEQEVSDCAELLFVWLISISTNIAKEHRSWMSWEYYWPKHKALIRITDGAISIRAIAA